MKLSHISAEKMKGTLEEIASFGKNADGSYTRACFSDEYFLSVEAVRNIMCELGMNPIVDEAGNVHGCIPGSDPAAPSIMTGSHLDTVPHGGLFDGAYGVAAGLEVARELKRSGTVLRHPFEVWGFNAEEANPMGGTFGSRAITGFYDEESTELAEALRAYGVNLQDIAKCRKDFSKVACYLELHIEQGGVLYNKNINIGVVSGIVGLVRYQITAKGQSNHAGTTMMSDRQDAMVAMAKLIAASTEAAQKLDDTLVLTVGTISLEPGSPCVIPGKVSCCFEMRHLDVRVTDRMIEIIRDLASKIPDADFEITQIVSKGATQCAPAIMTEIQNACQKEGYSFQVMPSGATHDAVFIGRQVPVGMIFIPSKDGISHDGREWSEPQDLANGAQVLFDSIVNLDKLPDINKF